MAWLVPASGAGAALRLGPDLGAPPNGGIGCQQAFSPCGWINFQSSDPATPAISPINGIVTSWRFRAGCCLPAQTESRTMTLKTFQEQASSDGYAHLDPVNTGPSFVLPAGNTLPGDPPTELPAHLPISIGQSVGIVADAPIEFATYSIPSMTLTSLNNGFSYGYKISGAVAISAVVEPDADGDGYGDETQDCNPKDATQTGACAPVFVPPPANPISVGTTAPCAHDCNGGGVVFSNAPHPVPSPRGDGGIVVELQCPPGSAAPCGGILYAELPKPKTGKPRISAVAPTILARASYSLKPGKKKNFQLTFSAKVLKFLAKKRTRKVIITIQPKGGQPISTTSTLEFPKPEPAKRD